MAEKVALLGVVVTFDLGAFLWLTLANIVFTLGWAFWVHQGTPWRTRLLMSVGVLTLCTVVGFVLWSWLFGVPVRDFQYIVLGGHAR